jgi:voltage-gated potassium channel
VAIPQKYVYFLGFLRISRAARVLRTYRLLSFSQSEETRELITFGLNFINFIFFSASLINATESLGFDEKVPNFKNWHDSLYYIMVTFSTIGFGDLTPSSTVTFL